MSVDLKKQIKWKNYESRFRAAMKLASITIVLVICVTSVNSIAYQRKTVNERGDNYIEDGGKPYEIKWQRSFNAKNKETNRTEGKHLNYSSEGTIPKYSTTMGNNYGSEDTTTPNILENLNYTMETTTNLEDVTESTTFSFESTTMPNYATETTTNIEFSTVENLTGTEFYDISTYSNPTTTIVNKDDDVTTESVTELSTSYREIENATEFLETTTLSEYTTTDTPTTENYNFTSENNTKKLAEIRVNNATECKNCKEKLNRNSTNEKLDNDAIDTRDDYTSYEVDDYEEIVKQSYSTTTTTEKPGAFGSIRNMATSLIDSLFESIVPKSFRDIFKRMQEQNDRLEVVKLRSREENGGIGQFGRSLLKGLTVPFNQLMQGVRDYGSLDSDKNFFAGVASDIVTLADSMSDTFKDRVRAIYPGTLWCGDGDMARSAEVGLFFMTDNCCKRHDSCKYYIPAGTTKYGLTNTGLFTRSHCECDKAFYKCLKRTNSFISMQIGITYFSILGPQCFKKEHPIIKCSKRTSITGQKCQEYIIDYSQPKMWQWFDNEIF